MFGLLKSLGSLAKDVATIVVAPVEIVVDAAGAVVRPVKEMVKEVVDDIKDELK